MDWTAATGWWVLAGGLVAVELATGSFYLLMMAAGAAAAALAAHAGLGATAQFVVAALVGGGATAAWHLKRARHPQSAPAASNRDVVLDIGETLLIEQWLPDGTARALYRGASWAVRFEGDGTPAPGRHRIVALHGSELAVRPA
ncbi:MAG: NfeD family protein [Rubrivivax sp.]|nr:NfeD family protein [Rubrivivax sp.]